jgi:ParB family chromosome partitioning protein
VEDQLGLFAGMTPEPLPERKGPELPVYKKGKLYALKVADVQPDALQPRRHFDEESLQELALSITKHGVLQPVIFRATQSGGLVLVAGQRRWQAATQAGLTTVPAVYTDGEPAEIALVENLLRQDLTAIEEAEAIDKLKSTHNYQLDQLHEILGKSISTLSEILSLTRLPAEIRDDCRGDRKIARSALLEISKMPDTGQMLDLYRQYREKGLSREKLRQNARNQKSPAKRTEIRHVRSWSRKFSRFDLTGLQEKERGKLKTELEKLHQQVRQMLDALA